MVMTSLRAELFSVSTAPVKEKHKSEKGKINFLLMPTTNTFVLHPFPQVRYFFAFVILSLKVYMYFF